MNERNVLIGPAWFSFLIVFAETILRGVVFAMEHEEYSVVILNLWEIFLSHFQKTEDGLSLLFGEFVHL